MSFFLSFLVFYIGVFTGYVFNEEIDDFFDIIEELRRGK